MSKDLKAKVTIVAEGNKAVREAKKVSKELTQVGKTGKDSGKKIDAGMKSPVSSLNKVSTSANKTGKDIKDAGDKGKNALNKIDNSSMKSNNALNTLATSAIGLSQAVSGLAEGLFGFQSAAVGLEKAQFGVRQMQLQLTRQSEDFKTALEEGSLSVREQKRAIEDLEFSEKNLELEMKSVEAQQMQLTGQFATMSVNIGMTIGQTIIMGKTLLTNRVISAGLSKQNTILTASQTANTASTGLNSAATVSQTGANVGLLGSIRATTVAMKTFMLSNPVTAAALVGTTVAIGAYETNTLGLRDSIEDLTGNERGSLPTLSKSLGLVQTSTEESADGMDRFQRKVNDFADTITQKQIPAVDDLNQVMDRNTKSAVKLTAAWQGLNKSIG